MRDELTKAYKAVRNGQMSLNEWQVWSGSFIRTLRALIAEDESQRLMLATVFGLWQSANRLLVLHSAKRKNIGKIRKERWHMQKMKELYQDIVDGRIDAEGLQGNCSEITVEVED